MFSIRTVEHIARNNKGERHRKQQYDNQKDKQHFRSRNHTADTTWIDLGIDSLDFLDIVFAIDKAFGIKIPLEQWTQEVNEGKVETDEYFVLKNLCAKIDELVAAKNNAG